MLLTVGAADAPPVAIPFRAVQSVHVSRGPTPRLLAALKAAIRPAFLGGGQGYLLSRAEGAARMRAAGRSALVFGILGGIIGSMTPKERWALATPPTSSGTP